MPRPNLSRLRRKEILDAFETCVLEYGIQGTSLETLAKAANMKRSILRHYIGNRDDIIIALSERWHAHYAIHWQDTLAQLDELDRVSQLIEGLFAHRDATYVQGAIIGEAIFSEAKRLPAIKAHVEATMEQFIEIFTAELKAKFPKATGQDIEQVAHGIHAQFLMSESLLPLGLIQEIELLKGVSHRLAHSLYASQ